MSSIRIALFSLCACGALQAQTSVPAGGPEVLSPNLARLAGTDSTSGTEYARYFLLQSAPGAAAGFDLSRPTLTAQCIKDRKGKLRFELFVNFGDVTDTTYYPPWKPTLPTDYPPHTEMVTVTMEFLGYTRFKPAKRQFERVLSPEGQLRYNTPGTGSSNMESMSYYLQVLRALPTLRVSVGDQSASFETAPLLKRLHDDPLCLAAGV